MFKKFWAWKTKGKRKKTKEKKSDGKRNSRFKIQEEELLVNGRERDKYHQIDLTFFLFQ